MNKIKISAIFIFAALLSGQTLEVDGQFNQFFTYYISSVDINTGETDIQLFNYRLDCPDCPTDINDNYSPVVAVDIKFKMTVRSAALGIDDEKTIMSLYTKKPIKILAPVQLDNRDFTLDALDVFDEHGNLVSISIGIDDDESLDEDEMMDMFNAIVQTAQLPDGEYKLSIDIEAGYYDFSSETWTVRFPVSCANNCREEIRVVTPLAIDLEEGQPGGEWERLNENIIRDPYPRFVWSSDILAQPILDNCEECGFYIRVAEFRCEDHSSIDDAIEDVTTLPIDQAAGWHYVGNRRDFTYPTSGAIDLSPGGIYVYQVQKRLSTTEGLETQDSPIYVFRYDAGFNQKLENMKEILSEGTFDLLFQPCGDLTGYEPTGEFQLDNVDFGEAEWQKVVDLAEKINQGDLSVINWEIRE